MYIHIFVYLHVYVGLYGEISHSYYDFDVYIVLNSYRLFFDKVYTQ